MTSATLVATLAEVALVALLVALFGGMAGTSALAAAAAGLVLMGALAVPAVALVLWGRRRSNRDFLASVIGVLLAKMVVVGAGILYVWRGTELPRLEFVWGLMIGWLLSFTLQAAVLRRTAAPPRT